MRTEECATNVDAVRTADRSCWCGADSEHKFSVRTISSVNTSDSATQVNDSTRLESRFLETRTRLKSRWEKRWLNSTQFFLQNDSTRVTINGSRLESASFLQNLRCSDGQIPFVCTQRNEHLLLPWWSRLAQIFCFGCVAVLCYMLRIKCPQLAQR